MCIHCYFDFILYLWIPVWTKARSKKFSTTSKQTSSYLWKCANKKQHRNAGFGNECCLFSSTAVTLTIPRTHHYNHNVVYYYDRVDQGNNCSVLYQTLNDYTYTIHWCIQCFQWTHLVTWQLHETTLLKIIVLCWHTFGVSVQVLKFNAPNVCRSTPFVWHVLQHWHNVLQSTY